MKRLKASVSSLERQLKPLQAERDALKAQATATEELQAALHKAQAEAAVARQAMEAMKVQRDTAKAEAAGANTKVCIHKPLCKCSMCRLLLISAWCYKTKQVCMSSRKHFAVLDNVLRSLAQGGCLINVCVYTIAGPGTDEGAGSCQESAEEDFRGCWPSKKEGREGQWQEGKRCARSC